MKGRSLPSLPALRVFEAAARLSSFKAAAEELAVTQSAVSHQVAALEGYLGVRLFVRAPNRVTLSDAGAIYFPFAREALDRIEEGTLLIRHDTSSKSLSVQIYVTVAMRWLIPRLYCFRRDNPDIAVRLDASSLDWEFNPDAADVGIGYTERPNRPILAYKSLLKAQLVAVCAPALSVGFETPRDFKSQPLLRVFTAEADLNAFFEGIREPALAYLPGAHFDSYLLAIEAATEGQGIVIAPDFLVAGDLRSGKLVRLAAPVPQQGSWYLMCLKRRANEPAIRRFSTWLTSESIDPYT